MAKKPMNNYQNSPSQRIDFTNKATQFSSGIKADKNVAVAEKPSAKSTGLTYEQIAERAKEIWLQRGCPANQDEKNWFDAESQLKRELGIR